MTEEEVNILKLGLPLCGKKFETNYEYILLLLIPIYVPNPVDYHCFMQSFVLNQGLKHHHHQGCQATWTN